MDASFYQLLDSPRDYYVCQECGHTNWYERDSCHSCGSEDLKQLTEEKVKEEIDRRKSMEFHFCMECTVEV